MRADEPAYPCNTGMVTRHEDGSVTYLSTGLTVREAFVMAAMQGLLAAPENEPDNSDFDQYKLDLALSAVEYADATLAAMEKGDET